MLALCLVMIVCSVAALVLTTLGSHHTVLALATELAMLVAMVDVCLFGSVLLPGVGWAVLLLAGVIVRAPGLRGDAPGKFATVAHLGGLLATAGLLVLLSGGSGHEMTTDAPRHHAPGATLAATVGVAAALYLAAETGLMVRAIRARTPRRRRDAARAASAAVSMLAMLSMAVLGA
jgi:hypothetical protein